MHKARINNVKVETLLEGAMKTIRNAQCLCDEADLLHKHQMFARSYALSHFAREEFGKSFMLYRAAIEVSAGIKVDWKKLDKRFRDHKQKITNDRVISMAMFSTMGGDIKKLDPRVMLSTHGIDYTNNRKNACLYVDWDKNKFVMPEEVVSESQSERNLSLATYRVGQFSVLLVQLSRDLRKLSKDDVRAMYPNELLENPDKFLTELMEKITQN